MLFRSFVGTANKELLQRAMSGDQQAFLDVINHVGRSAYSSAIQHQSALTDAHIGNVSKYQDSKLDARIKSGLTSNELSKAPSGGHPIVKAELNRVAQRLAAANPDAAPEDIALAARKYLSDLANSLSDKSTKTEDTKNEPIDYMQYLG